MAYYPQKTKTAATQPARPIDTLKSMLDAPSVQAQFKNALGAHKDTFIASLVDLYTGDKSLQTCNQAAVVAEALRAATLRLPLNKALGFSYIVVYNNSKKVGDNWVKEPTPTFLLGYKGYIQLAMRTGQYKTINADVVYEGEITQVNKLTGEIDFSGERVSDTVIGYFCYFELLNGFSKTLFVSLEDMAAYAKKFSPSIARTTTVDMLIAKANAPVDAQGKKAVGWEGSFNDMAIKTVIRRLLSKYGYLSVEMQEALTKDITADENAVRDDLIAEHANAIEINPDDFAPSAESRPSGDAEEGKDGKETVADIFA